jgi:hypothetical protein
MANYTKREERRAEMLRLMDKPEEFLGKRYPMPTCACGAPAKVASDQRGRTLFFCVEHTPPDIREMIVSSPLYAGRDPFEAY